MQTQTTAVGLVPTERRNPTQLTLMPVGQSQTALTRDQKRVAKEFGRETLVIEAERKKTEYGMWAIGDMRDAASFTFQNTVVSVLERQRQVQDKEYAACLAEFNRLNIQAAGRELLAAVEEGSGHILSVMAISLDLPQSSASGFWERLFG